MRYLTVFILALIVGIGVFGCPSGDDDDDGDDSGGDDNITELTQDTCDKVKECFDEELYAILGGDEECVENLIHYRSVEDEGRRMCFEICPPDSDCEEYEACIQECGGIVNSQ